MRVSTSADLSKPELQQEQVPYGVILLYILDFIQHWANEGRVNVYKEEFSPSFSILFFYF